MRDITTIAKDVSYPMKPRNTVLLLALLCYTVVVAESLEVQWTSKLLPVYNFSTHDTFQARAIAPDGLGNYLIAIEATKDSQTSVVLYKSDSSGNVVWMTTAETVRGIPFDISVDDKNGNAFVILSESKKSSNFGKAHVVRFTNILANSREQPKRIEESLFYSTPGNVGITKLFASVRSPKTGDLYITGGTSTELYRADLLGQGDAIVVRLDSSGHTLAAAQFGSVDNEVGLSIDMSNDGLSLVVVTKRSFTSGFSTSEIYRLDTQNLTIMEGPHSPHSHGADPLFNPRSISVSGPPSFLPGTLVTVVGGEALVRPDSQSDIYLHFFAKIASQTREVTVTFDGAKKKKGVDSCVSVHIGKDANAYCLGYTESRSSIVSRSLNLLVVSPTGELLLETERVISGNVSTNETPMESTLIESATGRTIVYVGHSRVEDKTRAIIGFIKVPKDDISPFKGFQGAVTGAGTVAAPASSPQSKNSPSIPAVIGGALGSLALLAAVFAGFAVIERRRRANEQSAGTRSSITTSRDYSREVAESFNDELTPRENGIRGGALA